MTSTLSPTTINWQLGTTSANYNLLEFLVIYHCRHQESNNIETLPCLSQSIYEGGDNNITNIVKGDPFRSLFSFPRWFDDFDFTPAQRGLKIYEDEKNIIVEAVVTGIPSKDVEVHIEDGVLTIKAEKTEENMAKGEHNSSNYQYYYTTALSGGRWDKADAEVEDGVLTLTIPKTEASRPRKITVKTKAKEK